MELVIAATALGTIAGFVTGWVFRPRWDTRQTKKLFQSLSRALESESGE